MEEQKQKPEVARQQPQVETQCSDREKKLMQISQATQDQIQKKLYQINDDQLKLDLAKCQDSSSNNEIEDHIVNESNDDSSQANSNAKDSSSMHNHQKTSSLQADNGKEEDQVQQRPNSQIQIASQDQLIKKASNEHVSEKRLVEEKLIDHNNNSLPPPNPLLPKSVNVCNLPPESPLKHIQFIQIKKFMRFKEALADAQGRGYDKIGKVQMNKDANGRPIIGTNSLNNKSYSRSNTHDEDTLDVSPSLGKTSATIQNIVFLRDSKIIDQKTNLVYQKAAFSHQNYLDINKLAKERNQKANAIKFKEESFRKKNFVKPKANTTQDGGSAFLYQLKEGEDDKTLLFESRFESGNLYLAQKVSDNEYNCLMQNDINTQGHTQWFYYKVNNTRKGHKVKFNILNYTKPDSLFNYGMKVAVYSEKKAHEQEIGWHRTCEDISYFANGIKKDVSFTSKSYYTATFTYKFEYDNDTVFFAYCYPYTYSDLNQDLLDIDLDASRRKFMSRKSLCQTLAGVNCEVITITSGEKMSTQSSKKAVVISSRVHPGETVGSWMMRGVLLFLTDPHNAEAKKLRENFIFKIIPMLNPDGVINGNYRCSLAGCDLNRRWKVPSKALHPTVYFTKKLLKQMHAERELVLYCDLHGHSRKQNVFMYGCNNKQEPEECRVFPYVLSKLSPYFSFEDSRFGIQKSKESTARISVYKELKTCPNIFTMESSFSGLDRGPMKGKHFTTEMLESMGKDLCRTILVYSNIHVPKELEDFKDNQNQLSQIMASTLKKNKDLLAKGDGDSSSGSESEPSEDNLQADELVKNLPCTDKTLSTALKKIQKKKKEEIAQAQKTPKPLLKVESPTKKDPNGSSRWQANRLPVQPTETKPQEPTNPPQTQKKPKPEMKDVATQTYRSDYQLIKARMMDHRNKSHTGQTTTSQALQQQSNLQSSNNNNVSISMGPLNGLRTNARNNMMHDFSVKQSQNQAQYPYAYQNRQRSHKKDSNLIAGQQNRINSTQQQAIKSGSQAFMAMQNKIQALSHNSRVKPHNKQTYNQNQPHNQGLQLLNNIQNQFQPQQPRVTSPNSFKNMSPKPLPNMARQHKINKVQGQINESSEFGHLARKKTISDKHGQHHPSQSHQQNSNLNQHPIVSNTNNIPTKLNSVNSITRNNESLKDQNSVNVNDNQKQQLIQLIQNGLFNDQTTNNNYMQQHHRHQNQQKKASQSLSHNSAKQDMHNINQTMTNPITPAQQQNSYQPIISMGFTPSKKQHDLNSFDQNSNVIVTHNQKEMQTKKQQSKLSNNNHIQPQQTINQSYMPSQFDIEQQHSSQHGKQQSQSQLFKMNPKGFRNSQNTSLYLNQSNPKQQITNTIKNNNQLNTSKIDDSQISINNTNNLSVTVKAQIKQITFNNFYDQIMPPVKLQSAEKPKNEHQKLLQAQNRHSVDYKNTSGNSTNNDASSLPNNNDKLNIHVKNTRQINLANINANPTPLDQGKFPQLQQKLSSQGLSMTTKSGGMLYSQNKLQPTNGAAVIRGNKTSYKMNGNPPESKSQLGSSSPMQFDPVTAQGQLTKREQVSAPHHQPNTASITRPSLYQKKF